MPNTFEESVSHYLEGIEAVSSGGMLTDCPDCPEFECDGSCGSSDPGNVCYDLDEGSFSRSRCDSCGSTYGGDRYTAHGLIPNEDGTLKDSQIIHLDICADCLFYHANGDVPEPPWYQTPYEYEVRQAEIERMETT